jgi:hypothetical protein
MERDTNEHGGRRAQSEEAELGDDDPEFASVEDVASPPGETPSVDDV